MQKYCCSGCFSDKVIKDLIEAKSTDIGECNFCSSKNTQIIPTNYSELFDLFDGLLSEIYLEDDTGKPLADCFSDDWGIFLDAKIEPIIIKELLSNILSYEVLSKNYSLKPSISQRKNTAVETWQQFKDSIKHKQRFIIDSDFIKPIGKILGQLELSTTEKPVTCYRARTEEGDCAFEKKYMLAPPKEKAGNGRANPAGIPYLYVASDINTAISELRPHIGESISVAYIDFLEVLHLIDLRNPKAFLSPFVDDIEEASNFILTVKLMALLGEELSRPVSRHASAYDYAPSQFLCEFIKTKGYDGVVYKSSVSDGFNVALFDTNKITVEHIQRVESHKISEIKITTLP